MRFDVQLFGARPDATPAENSAAIQQCIDAAAGRGTVEFSGCYEYDQTLVIPTSGLWIRGSGSSSRGSPSELFYKGTDYALELAPDFLYGRNQINLYGFRLRGNFQAAGGLDLRGPSKAFARLQNLLINGFTKSGAYAVRIDNTYHCVLDQVDIDTCYSGISTGGVSNLVIRDSWVGGEWSGYGVYVNASGGGTTTIARCVLQSGTKPEGQIGVYVEAGRAHIDACHFENLYQHYRINDGPSSIARCKMSGAEIDSVIDSPQPVYYDQMNAQYEHNYKVQATPGTVWSSHRGNLLRPVWTDGGEVIPQPSPVILVANSAPANLKGVAPVAAREYDGDMTLYFLDGNTTLRHNTPICGRFLLSGSQHWTAPAGSAIRFTKLNRLDGTQWQYIEIGRYEP